MERLSLKWLFVSKVDCTTPEFQFMTCEKFEISRFFPRTKFHNKV